MEGTERVCWRCGTPVVKRDLEQWFFRITAYAEELLEECARMDGWPERVLTMQENWIGRSRGLQFDFARADGGDPITVYTTRPDTLLGASFVGISPDHPLAKQLAGKESFHPELMAGFYVVRSIADIFAEDQKGYAFKQATLDPILPENKSDAQETEVINYFQANRKTKIQKGMMNKNGREFFYVARPVVNKAACNRCHGRREDAPTASFLLKDPSPAVRRAAVDYFARVGFEATPAR